MTERRSTILPSVSYLSRHFLPFQRTREKPNPDVPDLYELYTETTGVSETLGRAIKDGLLKNYVPAQLISKRIKPKFLTTGSFKLHDATNTDFLRKVVQPMLHFDPDEGSGNEHYELGHFSEWTSNLLVAEFSFADVQSGIEFETFLFIDGDTMEVKSYDHRSRERVKYFSIVKDGQEEGRVRPDYKFGQEYIVKLDDENVTKYKFKAGDEIPYNISEERKDFYKSCLEQVKSLPKPASLVQKAGKRKRINRRRSRRRRTQKRKKSKFYSSSRKR
jgi:hypothetical protein